MIFVDMLRAVNQNVCNRAATWNKLDDSLAKFGGIVYSNCYSPAPDTPRGLASIWSGSYPKFNGCDARIRYPKYFLDKSLDNMWRLFKRKNLALNLFVKKGNLKFGILPEEATDNNCNCFDDDDLKRFLDSVQISDNSATFIALEDYHLVLDDIHYRLSGLNRLYELVGGEIDLIFDKLGRDQFDTVLIFSDHGCMLEGDVGGLSHKGRIQTYLQLWIKNSGTDNFVRSDKFCSCMDIFPTMAFLLNDLILNRIDGLNLLTNNIHPFLVIEDYLRFSVTLEQVLGWWGIILPNGIIQTDCHDNWYYNGAPVQISPEQKAVFKTVLRNYSGSYEENVKGQKVLDHYNSSKNVGATPSKPRLYSNGEVRPPRN